MVEENKNKTIITTEDVKNIVNNVFKDSDNDTKIQLFNEDTGETKEMGLIEYLNFDFFNFRKRLENEDELASDEILGKWVPKFNVLTDVTYGLVDIIDMETAPSREIDNASVAAKITFLCPIEKIVNLEYYVTKIRNKYLGFPQTIQNSYGKNVSIFLLVGILKVDENTIQDTALGERVICELGFNFNYIANAETSYDVVVNFLPNAKFNAAGLPIVVENGEEKTGTLLNLPITKQTHQLIAETSPLPRANTPATMGSYSTALTRAITLNYYIYKGDLSQQLEDLFWSACTIDYDKQPNIPIALEVVKNGKSYKYNCILKEMEDVIENGHFIIGSLSLITSA